MTVATPCPVETRCPLKVAPCPCPIEGTPIQPDEYEKVITRTVPPMVTFPEGTSYEERVQQLREKLGLSHQLVTNELPPNTIASPGGVTFYQKVQRISRIYIDVKGGFSLVGRSKFIPKLEEDSPKELIDFTGWLWKAWGTFKMGGTFNLPTQQRLTNIATIAGLVQVGALNAIYSTKREGNHRVGTYHNPHLFWEMPNTLENGNRYNEVSKRWVPGAPRESWLCYVWIREGAGYRRTGNTPTPVTFRWD